LSFLFFDYSDRLHPKGQRRLISAFQNESDFVFQHDSLPNATADE